MLFFCFFSTLIIYEFLFSKKGEGCCLRKKSSKTKQTKKLEHILRPPFLHLLKAAGWLAFLLLFCIRAFFLFQGPQKKPVSLFQGWEKFQGHKKSVVVIYGIKKSGMAFFFFCLFPWRVIQWQITRNQFIFDALFGSHFLLDLPVFLLVYILTLKIESKRSIFFDCSQIAFFSDFLTRLLPTKLI